MVTLNDVTLTDATARLVDKRPLITSSLMCKVKNKSKGGKCIRHQTGFNSAGDSFSALETAEFLLRGSKTTINIQKDLKSKFTFLKIFQKTVNDSLMQQTNTQIINRRQSSDDVLFFWGGAKSGC